MYYPMRNIQILRDSLIQEGWHITAFPASYKGRKYTVLFENIPSSPSEEMDWFTEKVKKYNYIAVLTFFNQLDTTERLETYASVKDFSVSAKELRTFFHIEYSDKLRDAFQTLYRCLGRQVPQQVQPVSDSKTKKLILSKISERSSEDENAINCIGVMRNSRQDGRQKLRTIYNTDKARILRPSLFEYFKNDPTISFRFSADKPECSDSEILSNFASKK